MHEARLKMIKTDPCPIFQESGSTERVLNHSDLALSTITQTVSQNLLMKSRPWRSLEIQCQDWS